MKRNIKVTLEYLGSFTTATSRDYRIARIDGAPTVEVLTPGAAYKTVRVGDLITEAQADELSSRVAISTLPKRA